MTTHVVGIGDGTFEEDELPKKTVYDNLSDALSEKVKKEPLTLVVPGRPKVAMMFDPTIEFELYNAWVDKASKPAPGKKNREGNPDYLKMAMTVISHTNIGILFGGEQAYSETSGDALDIKQAEVHRMLKVPEGAVGTAIRRVYGNDGHAIQTMHQILEAAGYSLTGEVHEYDESDPLEL